MKEKKVIEKSMSLLSSKRLSYLKALRPWQWAKNLLILVPFILSNSYSFEKLQYSLALFFLFSLFVSGNYILNDLSDIHLDKNHPEKKDRPIAAGEITPYSARKLSLFLFLIPGVITYSFYEIKVLYLFFLYLGVAVLYTKYLKFINLIDAVTISFLFIIRIVIGGIATNVAITIRLYVFIFLMSIFIVYLKKNSILNKKSLENNLFHKTLKQQNKKFSFKNTLFLFGGLANLSLLFWSFTLLTIITIDRLLALVIYNIIFLYITIRLIKSSTASKLEDFVYGVVADKVLLILFSITLLLFIYFYF